MCSVSEMRLLRGGLIHETERRAGYAVHVTYWSKEAAGPDTEPRYSCWVETRDGRRSPQLNMNEDRYPLSDPKVWARINEWVAD